MLKRSKDKPFYSLRAPTITPASTEKPMRGPKIFRSPVTPAHLDSPDTPILDHEQVIFEWKFLYHTFHELFHELFHRDTAATA